jgi:hypothetical protein
MQPVSLQGACSVSKSICQKHEVVCDQEQTAASTRACTKSFVQWKINGNVKLWVRANDCVGDLLSKKQAGVHLITNASEMISGIIQGSSLHVLLLMLLR